MPLVTSQKMLSDAQKNGYAVGAFNVENMEMAMAVIAAAEELCAPVMLQTTSSTLKYATPEMFCAMVSALAKDSPIPITVHLDHGSGTDIVEKTLNAGYTSVMIDGSQLSFEDNIKITQQSVAMAKAFNVPVEAELGRVGGKEDETESAEASGTDPQEAVTFVKETGIDSLAIGIGTAHGFYKGTPVLDKKRLAEIRAVVDIPLVLHGASGLSDKDVQDCIALGICKVNFATELRVAFTDGIKQTLAEHPETFDPKPLGKTGIQNVKELVANKIKVCGCDGKA